VVTIELARKLAELTPGDLSASFFCNSGSEAVEASIKLARQYHQANGEGRRYKVVSLRRAYHGATMGALSATGWSPHFAMRMGLFGPRPLGGTTLALAPPLVFTKAQAERTVDVLGAALSEVEAEGLPAVESDGETRREPVAASREGQHQTGQGR
jgi:adenosylmethionine-8-amino-7-oxononanoate aminotransferase